MTGLDATIARALSGYNAGDVLSFDSLREAVPVVVGVAS